MISAGKLREQIVFQTRGESTDEWGGTIPSWTTFATVRAKARPIRGREMVAAQAAQNETEVVFYIRHLAGLNTSMRVVHNSKNYDILSIINIDERNREMEISTKTGLSEG